MIFEFPTTVQWFIGKITANLLSQDCPVKVKMPMQNSLHSVGRKLEWQDDLSLTQIRRCSIEKNLGLGFDISIQPQFMN